mmetsp:Transcript_11697/g.25086  ORF Transcript_11697/g.25086 Transcript_11697/m.25086 type:complete len:439 (-) Transcript_11697:325-1641(-)
MNLHARLVVAAALCVLVINCLCAKAISDLASLFNQTTRFTSAPSDYCKDDSLQNLYKTIDDDLQHWVQKGISQELMDHALRQLTCSRLGQKAVGILFDDGVPYILSNTSRMAILGHHAGLFTAHFKYFEALGRRFGSSIPNVEFIIGTADEPSVKLHTIEHGQAVPPLLRFCKSKYHGDILVPDIHFQMRKFSAEILDKVASWNSLWPWQSKKPELFGRFSQYRRMVHADMPALNRTGSGGQDICREAGPALYFCDARVHYMQWAKRARRQGAPIDVAQQPRKSMEEHASYKYLLHLDGQSCSSRLEQLLALGSLVLKEESGYYAFFHRLLQPYQHYVPVWKKEPEDTLEVLQWASQHDEEAHGIAVRAQQLALTYLNKEALACYWYTTLARLSSLLKYKPGQKHRNYDFVIPVTDYLQSREGRRWARKYGVAELELP